MTHLARSANLAPMPVKDPLMAQIAALLTDVEEHDDPAQLERTLTDGYARALALEAERRRFQQRLGEMTVAAAQGETGSRLELAAAVRRLKRQDDEIDALRRELSRLRQRHSLAVRSVTP